MYQYTEFDKQFVRDRAAQYRDQLERNLAGTLGEDEFRPLRLQNGWYIQRTRDAARRRAVRDCPRAVRVLARIAREYDRPDPALCLRPSHAGPARPDRWDAADRSKLKFGYGLHYRTNVQYNWIRW